MRGTLVDVAIAGIEAAAAGLIALVGAGAERVGVHHLLTGDIAVGGWYLYVGTVALYVGLVLIGRDRFGSRLADLSN